MHSRRDFGKVALSAASAAMALAQAPAGGPGGPGRGAPPPPLKSTFNGVQIGVITYSFRQGVTAQDLIPTMKKLGITCCELMSNHAEALAGAPRRSRFWWRWTWPQPDDARTTGCRSGSPQGGD